ncbi:MAG: hypothetical protein LBD68_09545 [Zoogloeaceae bacterium]|jgi:hypothetical protein|nr:hypothetical protein [Zoogloeaceae bacterium]
MEKQSGAMARRDMDGFIKIHVAKHWFVLCNICARPVNVFVNFFRAGKLFRPRQEKLARLAENRSLRPVTRLFSGRRSGFPAGKRGRKVGKKPAMDLRVCRYGSIGKGFSLLPNEGYGRNPGR